MKVAITTEAPSLEAMIDPRFGRCAYFLIVETEDLGFEAIENPNLELGGGVGIQSAQFMAEKGVKYVLTGNCGPNAHQVLSAAGIEVVVGCSGMARDVIERFKAGQLPKAEQPNVADHFGTSAGGGMGRGGGRGGGQGRGGGRGGGQGRGGGSGRY